MRSRPILGTTIVVAVVVALFLTPWRSIGGSIGRFIGEESDDRPAWVPMDGYVYKIALFPELFAVLGARYGGDGKATFAVPKMKPDDIDYLANDRFGAVSLFRCIATRTLGDRSPAGTIGWCDHYPNPYR